MTDPPRIYLSPPHIGPEERALVTEAFDTNWIAPVGPHVDAFEGELAERVGAAHCVALSSGTAALHLALQLLGVGEGDEVIVPSLTFAASAFPVTYLGARPVFVDSETVSWNVDPALLSEAVEDQSRSGRPPAAVVVVDLYGQTADLDPIRAVCDRHGIPLIEDAAEALGATYQGQAAGTLGTAGFYSFNGNKIITTSGGGALVSDDGGLISHARKLATQAREPAPHYEHSEIGYNYRLSNVLAGIGRGQLRLLDDRVARRRATFAHYVDALGDLPGVAFQPEAPWGASNRWLTCLTIEPSVAGTDRERVRLALEAETIEARPVWKPMHLQPVFRDCAVYGGGMSERLFQHGLCLPSGSNLSALDLDRITSVIRREFS